MLDGALKLIEAVTKLIGVLVWPALLLFVLVAFGSALREFIYSLGELSFKGAGFEALFKRRQTEFAGALTEALVSRPEPGSTPPSPAEQARTAVKIASELVTPRLLRRTGRSRILWVDDRPSNNISERRAFEALGIEIVVSTSTEDAIQKLGTDSFDVIISDMGRPPDTRAGYTLLEKLRSSGNQTPFIIYAGSRAPEHQAEARRRGALGCTNSPRELLEMVLSALGPC